jgi:hypothetical protein
MWRPNEPVEEDVADPPGIDLPNKRRRSRRRAWRDGLADQTVVKLSKMFGPTERSSAPSSAVLILDQRSSLRSLTGWQACCGDFVGPARSKLACLRCRVLFCSHASRTRPADLVNRGHSHPSRVPMAIAKPPARTDETMRRRATQNHCQRRPCARRSHHGRSCAFPTSTRPCSTGWAAMK